MKKVLAMILAGGRGERLYPLTRDRAKPAVPFGGIYRIVDFTLSNCINSDIRRIYVLTQYKSTSLNRHIQLGWNILSVPLGEFIGVIPAQQRMGEQWYQGTADAIFQNLYLLQQEKPDHLLVLSGDHIYKMDYRKMIAFHLEEGADLTVAAIRMDRGLSREFGVLEVDGERRIIGFEEKPEVPKPIPGDPEGILASMGVYIFQTEVLVRQLIEDARSESSHDFGKDIIPRMIQKGGVFAFDFRDGDQGGTGYWRDVGTIDAYFEANMDLVSVTPHLNLYDPQWPLLTYQPTFPPAKTVWEEEGRTGMAINSILSNGCIISGGVVRRSILSPQVRVNSYAEVENSILLDGVNVGRHAKIRRAIIDKEIQIPSGMEIGYHLEEDAKRFTVSGSGIVVVPKWLKL
ncbi:MAG: glucose-1-phosphate adenylyltransferase [Deltaproteobacteria bacterium RBG_16_48_10]|nr:MAG: glucose-1-phosphate adenylyltransferase [Deltaproteobacteria bacterium RBG_16_48_10]